MPGVSPAATSKRYFAALSTSSTPDSKKQRPNPSPPAPPPVLHPADRTFSFPLYTCTGTPLLQSELPLSVDFFEHPQPLKCATYNTFSCSPSHSPHQTRALLSIIHRVNADIISLQEVSAAFHQALMEHEGTAEYYASSLERYFEVAGTGEGGKGGKGGKSGEREGVVLLVRKGLVGRGSTVRMTRMESARGEGGKALIILMILDEGFEKVRVTSSHFSSLPGNIMLRDRQYGMAHGLGCAGNCTVSIVMGDFNNSANFKLEPFLDSVFCRIPAVADSFRDGPTFGTLYPYVPGAPRNKPRKGRRIDRIFVTRQDVSCSKYAVFGGDMVRDEKGIVVRDREGAQGVMWPSDHLGVSVVVSMEKSTVESDLSEE